ncbi:MAG TPA: CHRD domain-containing protein [Vicinamibacteria bacterium]
MNRRLLATMTVMLLAGAVFILSDTVYSDDDDDDFRRGLRFFTILTGDQEVPAVATEGTGRVDVRFDAGFTQARVELVVDADDLTGPARRAHFHCAPAGVNGPIAFGLFEPGECDFDGRRARCTLRNEDFTGADCLPTAGRPVNNIAALALAMREGLIYGNVHTAMFPGGEIRGQMLER